MTRTYFDITDNEKALVRNRSLSRQRSIDYDMYDFINMYDYLTLNVSVKNATDIDN
jgi:hypothetical protein